MLLQPGILQHHFREPIQVHVLIHRPQSHHFSEYKMLRHIWSSSWVHGSTSLHVFSNCIGCLSAGASSSNCVVLCIQFSTETVRCIYQTSLRQWVPVDRVFTYDHHHRPTTCYRNFAPSSASVPFLTLVRLHGTDYPKTFALNRHHQLSKTS